MLSNPTSKNNEHSKSKQHADFVCFHVPSFEHVILFT